MNLTFAEDFTSNNVLDSELLAQPESGIWWNRGVHSSVTIENLDVFLPKITKTFSAYVAGITYGNFMDTRKKSDIVTYEDNVYQSISESNTGNTPGNSPSDWLLTNIDSLRIKAFIFSVYDNVKAALNINRKLIENQYIYNVGEDIKTLPNDYAAWVFEPKGSDYVKIRVNQIALQANTDVPQSLYIVNQGRLIDTLTLTPVNGVLEFEDINYTIYGKGSFYFIIDSQDVLSQDAYNDSLRYKGFVCYPVSGIGTSPETATYNEISVGNGLNFNISAYLDSDIYIENNQIDLAKFYQSQFEYDFIKLMIHNGHNRFNIEERQQSENMELLSTEAYDLQSSTVAKSYKKQLKIAEDSINTTFDKFLRKKKGLRIKRKVI